MESSNSVVGDENRRRRRHFRGGWRQAQVRAQVCRRRNGGRFQLSGFAANRL